MAAQSTTMESLIQIFKLAESGVPIKEICRRTNIARNTVRKYLKLLDGRSYSTLSKKELAALVYDNDTSDYKGLRYQNLIKHFEDNVSELEKTGVTKQLLWIEYKEKYPEGYNYSQYCFHFQEYLQSKDVVMHLEHNPAEEVMVDFAGHQPVYVELETGEQVKCQLFIASAPFSGLVFCRLVHSQKTLDFVRCINEMAKYFGGMPKIVICDNLKTAVTKSDRYEPVFTDLCYQMSDHYRNVFQAARPVKPRDKAMVEKTVSIVYNHIIGPLRKQTFHSLEEINAAYRNKLDELNNKPYKGTKQSRLTIFNDQEKEHLIALPAQIFEMKKSVVLTVQRNYHVQLSEDHHYYSAPYIYAGKKVKVLYDDKVVEIYCNHQRIAFHQRTNQRSSYHTQPEHMPSSHQMVHKVRGWTQSDLLYEGGKIGPSVQKAIERVLQSSFYPEQNMKSCHGILMLKNKYTSLRLEAACARALTGTRVNYTVIKSILEKGFDQKQDLFSEQIIPAHENIRGPEHYL
ncbi:MAG TPA: IS21 family transposase [Saprospiraceae bacterium]|nr:IS21 family transposase [Saprospiraceae bacterium]HNG07369.1 IS21 family transposase [Saprospiraceae bacterium]HNG37323.1 IS21 family transposase [Nitrosomonas sp.]